MAIYQVARLGRGFTVLVDGVSHGSYVTRGAAVSAALKIKEENK